MFFTASPPLGRIIYISLSGSTGRRWCCFLSAEQNIAMLTSTQSFTTQGLSRVAEAPNELPGRRRAGSTGAQMRVRAQSSAVQLGAQRERAATMLPGGSTLDDDTPEEGLEQIAQVLNEESATPGRIDLQQAPILGPDLLRAVKDGDAAASGAGSVQDLQRRIERVTLELQSRFDAQQERFARRFCDLSFDERDVEEDFRNMTFNGQRKYMYVMAVLVMTYSGIGLLLYDVRSRGCTALPGRLVCRECARFAEAPPGTVVLAVRSCFRSSRALTAR